MRSLVSAVLLVACVHPASLRIEPGMGHVARSIRTTSPEARRHFEAGLALAYGFNYDEAAYEFVVALHADPSCAMCAWGLAYVSGPNINDPFKQGPAAVDAAARAVSLAKSPVEVALARAIGARFGVVPTMEMPERQKLDAAYTAAMRTAAQAAPDDDDVQTLYAEALIQDTPPFVQAWPKDGSPPLAHVVEARAVIERVLARSPEHIGAIHFYTHIVDGGPYMKLAVPYAERLALQTFRLP